MSRERYNIEIFFFSRSSLILEIVKYIIIYHSTFNIKDIASFGKLSTAFVCFSELKDCVRNKREEDLNHFRKALARVIYHSRNISEPSRIAKGCRRFIHSTTRKRFSKTSVKFNKYNGAR